MWHLNDKTTITHTENNLSCQEPLVLPDQQIMETKLLVSHKPCPLGEGEEENMVPPSNVPHKLARHSKEIKKNLAVN
jgi:hypothetical protein